jgi:hypothetical protein
LVTVICLMQRKIVKAMLKIVVKYYIIFDQMIYTKLVVVFILVCHLCCCLVCVPLDKFSVYLLLF